MFWGKVLKEGEPYKVQHALEDGEYPVLHLSSAVLGKSDPNQKGKTYVHISMGKELKNLQIAVLSNDREVQALDLYLNISQDITISVKGKNEVHLSGYFEPNSSMDDQIYPNELADLEDDEDEEDESEEEVAKPKVNGEKKKEDVEGFKKGSDLDKSLKAANKNTVKNSMEVESESDDDSDDDDDDDEDGEFEQIPGLDLEAEEGEEESDEDDEEINSSDAEDDDVLQKLQNLKKSMSKPQAAGKKDNKKSKKVESSSSSDDDSSEEEIKPAKKKQKH